MAGFRFALAFRSFVLYARSRAWFLGSAVRVASLAVAACGTDPVGPPDAPPQTQGWPSGASGGDGSGANAASGTSGTNAASGANGANGTSATSGTSETGAPYGTGPSALDAASDPSYGHVDGGPLSTTLAVPTDAAPDAFAACAIRSVEASRTPLDLFFMLDTSGSMNDLVADGQSKWSQISAAVSAFASDPASAGLGMGVQYFPLDAAGVPSSCSRDSQCGSAGPCVARICDDGSGDACQSDDDCFAASCVPIAACANDPNSLCTTPGSSCGADANGFALGVCQTATPACANGDSCASADYRTPAIGFDSLPGIANAVTQSLGSRIPQGGTPTAAALEGALQGARDFAAQHPDHKVVAVIATDGMPNEVADSSGASCTSASDAVPDVVSVAASGLAGSPSIETFGIGVFTPDDIASGTDALNQIAAAGGSGQPYIVATASTSSAGGGSSIESQFAAALNAIRGSTLPCQFQLPTLVNTSSQFPDYSEVNVELSEGPDAGAATIPYVAPPQACGAGSPASYGWSYDVDPSQGSPNAIVLCPAACAMLQAAEASRVDIVLGCHTVVSPR